ncbi:MAG: hypothetical protein EOT04_02910 [Candidatus Chaera renei]|uniref:Phage tail lysozyme domain-containing protein n=1 Tax=Candidatus Chaera renei TaxID=2506947 RepID=A0A4Q0AG34_9BACT|nr:MAG: hypothetical protein EOT04_02910 [Candidatus Chaera renei]
MLNRGLLLTAAMVFTASWLAWPLAAQANDFYSENDILFYDKNAPKPTTCLGTVALAGSTYAEMAYNYFVGKGLSPVQAAGIMGNLQAESGINPKRVQGTQTPSGDRDFIVVDGKTGYGIAQWTSAGRQQGLLDAAKAVGKPESDMAVQLDYLWQELNAAYKNNTLTPLLSATDIVQATAIFMKNFERPADDSAAAVKARSELSMAWLVKYGSAAPTGSVSSITSPSPATAGVPLCNGAAP